jgi:hypothetical protein
MYVKRLNSESASASPIVLRQKDMVRLVFKPTLVKNHQNPDQPLGGEFIYQKKRKAAQWDDPEEWDDEETESIYRLEFGAKLKLAVDRDELDLLLRHWQALYDFYRQSGIPTGRSSYDVPEKAAHLRGSTSQLLDQVLAQAGENGLATMLKWASDFSRDGQSISQLSALDAGALQRLNVITGIGSLKKVLELWNANQQNSDEGFWHSTLTKNSFVLSQIFSTPVILFKGKAFVGGKGIDNQGGKYPDFLLKNTSTNNVLIIEIKTPETAVLGSLYRPPNVYGPSPELSGAVVQSARYKDTLFERVHRNQE